MSEQEFNEFMKEIRSTIFKFTAAFIIGMFLGVLLCQTALAWEMDVNLTLPNFSGNTKYKNRDQYNPLSIFKNETVSKQNEKRNEIKRYYYDHPGSDKYKGRDIN